ncbi:MAG: hypothetical protein IPK77_10865 [Cellvibrio sp.]|nr:hypothetical protein [Cellvibrio sp.]
MSITDSSMNTWHLDSHLALSVGQYSDAGIKTNNEDSIFDRVESMAVFARP